MEVGDVDESSNENMFSFHAEIGRKMVSPRRRVTYRM